MSFTARQSNICKEDKSMIYNVTFKWSDGVYCSNVVVTDKGEEAIRDHYEEYENVWVTEGREYDLQDAKRRGKPIIKI